MISVFADLPERSQFGAESHAASPKSERLGAQPLTGRLQALRPSIVKTAFCRCLDGSLYGRREMIASGIALCAFQVQTRAERRRP